MSDQKAPELEPCPFCGGEIAFGFFGNAPNIHCGTCRYERDFYGEDGPMNRAAACAAWNTRADLAPKVKLLEWRQSVISGWNDDWHTVPTGYTIRCADENGWKWSSALGVVGYEYSASAAKAAAQADYEARILAALEWMPAPQWQPISTAPRDGADTFGALISEAVIEGDRAMRRFPQPNYVISKIAEESGEVVKAAIHCAEGRDTKEHVREEMRQTIAMLYRLWVEGDEVHGLGPIKPAAPEAD